MHALPESKQGKGNARAREVAEHSGKADMTATRRYGGVGLGLSIAKELVNAHNGSISVHSDGVGRGTAVVVRLPVLQVWLWMCACGCGCARVRIIRGCFCAICGRWVSAQRVRGLPSTAIVAMPALLPFLVRDYACMRACVYGVWSTKSSARTKCDSFPVTFLGVCLTKYTSISMHCTQHFVHAHACPPS
eukprot:scaffold67904_cov21-Tisochrysis_lutea.AAC.3